MATDAFILGAEEFPGLGDKDYPGFPADDCPGQLADLSKHHSLMADVFKRSPELYAQLRGRRTALGVGLARCIKSGMDNRGHPMIKTIGAVAGDEECYETFRPLFDELIRLRHGEQGLARPHAPTPRAFLSQLRPDPTEKYVLSVQVRAARNLRGMRFSPACSFEERREVERVAARALLELEGPLQGSYHPLRGSQSCPSKAGGMSVETEQELLRKGLLFSFPDSSAVLSSGLGRHWPDARGVFVNGAQTLAVWVNEEEHLRAVAARQGGDLKGAFQQITDALDGVVASFQRHKDCPQGFAYSNRLGFLTSCPSNIGTALRVSAIVKLPLITSRQNGLLADWCSRRRITARSATGENGSQLQGVLEISHRDRLGVSENETVNLLINSVADLVHAERLLEHGGAGLQPPAAAPAPSAQAADEAKARAPAAAVEEDMHWELAGAALGQLLAGALAGGGGEGPPATAPPASAPEAAGATQGARRTPPLGDIKARTAAMLQVAVDSGTLSTALDTLAKSQQTGGSRHIGELRLKTAERLFEAAQSGALGEALASAGDGDPLASARAAEKIQAAGRGMLSRRKTRDLKGAQREEAAAEKAAKGPPAASAAPGPAPGPEPGAAALRRELRSLLEGALRDGSLGRAVEEEARRSAAAEEQRRVLEAAAEMRRVLEAALADGSLERLLRSNEFSDEPLETSLTDVRAVARPPEPQRGPAGALADVRFRTADLLWDACDSGALEQALGTLRGQAGLDVEDIRRRMKDSLHDAVDDGSLEQVFQKLVVAPAGESAEEAKPPPASTMEGIDIEDVRSRMLVALSSAAAAHQAGQPLALPPHGMKAAAPASDIDTIRKKVRQGLEDGFTSGRLKRWLVCEASEGASAAKKPAEIVPVVAKPAAIDKLDCPRMGGAAFSQCAQALLEAISGCDRRIGLLNASIAEVRRCIGERDIQASQMESELDAMRQDFESLDADLDRQREAIAQAEAVSSQLHENGRKLAHEIDAETLKQRHAAVDLDSSIFSARSDTSTACTMYDPLPLQLTRDVGALLVPAAGGTGRSGAP